MRSTTRRASPRRRRPSGRSSTSCGRARCRASSETPSRRTSRGSRWRSWSGSVPASSSAASRTLLDATSVVIEFLRPIPGIALIPLALLAFGLGVPTVRFVVAYAAAWPILLNTLYGVRGVDRMLHDVARTSGVGRTGRLFRVTLPAALPSIATGIRVSAAIAPARVRDRRVLHDRRRRRVHGAGSRSRTSCRRCTRQ